MRKLFSIAPALFLLAGCDAAPPASLVLVTLDTLRADRLGSYGSTRDLTSRLDELAAESIRFADVTSQTPLTTPSHASILTGLSPPRHGIRNNESFRLPETTATLATVLRAAGYRTAAFIGALPLESRYGLDRGFDVYDEEFLRRSGSQERKAEEVLAAAEGFVRAGLGSSEPFFLWVHLFDAHTPYEAPEPFRSRHLSDPYGAEIAYLDDSLGRFLDELRREGVLERAVVSVVADHGEALGEHGEATHGALLSEATLRVPWLLRLPEGRLGGRVFESPVRALDVAPTLLGVLGAPGLEGADGVDLSPFLDGGNVPELSAYSETLYLHLLLGWSELKSLRRGALKVVDGARAEAFDLSLDPQETTNLLEGPRPGAERLLRELREIDVGASGAAVVNQDTAERLAALGYATGVTSGAGARRDPRDGMAIWREIEAGTTALARDPPAAGKHFERALELDPGNGLALKSLGDVRLSEGRMKEAIDLYLASIASGFAHPDLDLALARAFLAAGRPAEAVEPLERFLNERPENGDALLLRGQLLRRQGRIEEAEVALHQALQRIPDDGTLLNELGSVLAERNRRQEARRAFERAMAAAPEAPEPRRNLAVLLGGPDGERLLREAIRLDPEYARARIDLARTLAETGRVAEAEAESEAALRLRPDEPEALFIAARTAELAGRRERARDLYRRFLELAPPELAEPREMARRRLSALGGKP